MNIKNYTSTVDAARSMQRIEEMLVEIGATSINKQYQDKICKGITFLYFDLQINDTLCFQLKAQVEECFKIFWSERTQKTESQKKAVMLQANRTAWKVS